MTGGIVRKEVKAIKRWERWKKRSTLRSLEAELKAIDLKRSYYMIRLASLEKRKRSIYQSLRNLPGI